MKEEITGEEYSKSPAAVQGCYEFVSHNIYKLKQIDNHTFIAMMYYHANNMSYAAFKIWYLKNSPVRVIDNLEVT